MNDLELEPLPDDLAAALAQSVVPPLPPGVAEAVLAKVKVSAGLSAAAAVTSQVAASSKAGAAATKAGVSALLKVLPVVTLATGLGLGVAADRLVLRPTAVERVVERVEVPAPAAVVEAAEEARPTPPPAKPQVKKAVVDTLGKERVLLDLARSALNAQDVLKALAAVEAHAAQYPSGQLVEEREALAVQVLIKGGRRDEALRRMKSFSARFPDSPLVPALEALLR